MPQIIHPKISGTVVIEMTHEESKVLAHALNLVLDLEAPNWPDKKVRDTTSGRTCDDFLRALRRVVS